MPRPTGPVTSGRARTPSGPAFVRSSGFAAATISTQRRRPQACSSGTARRRCSRPTRCSRRSSSATRRPAACLRATTSSRSATSPAAAPWTDPRTYTGTITIDDSPAPPDYWARWKAFPASPPLATQRPVPVGQLEHRHPQDVVLALGPGLRHRRRQPRVARRRGTSTRRRTRPTFTTSGNNNKAATSWDERHGAERRRSSCRRATRAATTRSRGRTTGTTRQCQRAAAETPGTVYDDSAAAVNLFVMHNRMHDFSYYLGFTEQNWNGQSSNFGNTETLAGGRPADRRRPVGRADRRPATTPTCSRMPDGASSVTNMYFWQPLAGSFYAPCVDGDYDQGVIGHEFGHMIENRMIGKGTNPRRLPRRLDGRGLRRPGLDRVPAGERLHADRRRGSVRDGHVRDGQQGARDPQLRHELPADRRLPDAVEPTRTSTR